MISDRPATWNQVVGQERVIRVLHALLGNPSRMTRGLIFEGPWAVGKTSCAYLFARGLMCLAGGLGCGKCASCETMDEDFESHPSLKEVDASHFPSAVTARELLENLYGQPTLGARRVVIVDEAHNLSTPAWDVFLKPLDAADNDVVYLFVTSKGDAIPGPIRSRCSVIRFAKVDADALTGMLVSAADREHIPYRMDGLRLIARYAEGRPRDAMKGLGLVAALGEVTTENVETALNFEARMIGEDIYVCLTKKDVSPAIQKADELAQRIGPNKVIETMFSLYMEDITTKSAYSPSFAPLKDMTAFFIKWGSASKLPADIIPLFVIELNEMRGDLYRKPEQERTRTLITPTRETRKPVAQVMTPKDMWALLES
jgi:DNA polymerase-3 subunit gamma/tau